jgi:penicillin-binding protein 1A
MSDSSEAPTPPAELRSASGFGRRDGFPETVRPVAAAPPPRPPWRLSRGLAIAAVVVLVLIGAAGLGWAWFQGAYLADVPAIPSREALWTIRRTPGMTFLDREGVLIATRGAKYGTAVTLADLPAYAPKAFLAAEDRRFYRHGAIDFYAIARAARRDLKERRAAEGGSTLTQQLARTLFLKPEHTFKRKVQEAVLASRLEAMLGKDQVLELYLNRTFFGAGAYGLDAASQTYFGHPARTLTVAESALLAAVPNAPSRLALTNDPAAALARSRRILGIMREEGWITPEQLAQALASPPQLAPPQQNNEGEFSYILDQAAAEAAPLAVSAGAGPDLVVRLTIDRKLQTAGLEAVRWGVLTLGRGRRVSQGSMVVLGPDGAIRVMVGGLDHDKSAYNRVTQAKRQPGSSFKAFVFGAAMERGVHPGDIRQDAPIALGNWNPENYGGHFSGAVTVREALARSINTVSVRLTNEVGPDTVAEFARRCGLSDIPQHVGASIALGAYEVTLLELASGYQVFQRGGGRTMPYLIEELRTTRGDVIFLKGPSAPVPVYDPLYATRMVKMMEGVITGGTGVHANIGRPQAGKTGTSQNWRDAWFVGFTPDLLAGVWVGNDDNRPMAHVTGGELPAAIWKRFMTVALKSVPPSDFAWLSTEPEPPPVSGPPAEPGAYVDEPMVDQGAAPEVDAPPQDEGGAKEPYDPYGDPPPPRYRDLPPDEGDAPPPRGRGYYDAGPPPDDGAKPRQEAPLPRSWGEQSPDDPAPPPKYRY